MPADPAVPSRPDRAPDLIVAGGGLAGGLIALALATLRPDIDVLLLEEGARLGGEHIWSFFDSDIDDAGRALVVPLVTARWAGHDVRFDGYGRTLAGGYNSIFSDRFDAVLRDALGARARTGVAVAALAADAVTLADGSRIAARAVIDARGLADLSMLDCGYQKFVGRMLTLAAPHGLTRPVIMDAAVDQAEGYRFVYLLPFGAAEIFVEDTYYSRSPDLDVAALTARIDAYAAARGWRIAATGRQETGVLPVVARGDFDAFWPAGDGIARAGVRAGLFHPTTGYSLPDAVGFAIDLATRMPLDGAALARFARARARARWRRRGFYRLLDRLLFDAAAPAERHRVFARFYRLPEPLIARFYAGDTSWADRARILCGRPPVRISSAMTALAGRS